jgi:uncharacterized oxidoreductase
VTVAVAAGELERFATDVLVAVGARPEDAAPMAQVVVASDLAGHESCGLRQLPSYVDAVRSGLVDPAARPVVDLDRGSLLRVDGRTGFGHVTFRFATDLVVERARAHGICGVAVHNTHYLGRVADFADGAARAGVVTMAFLNQSGSCQVVAPHGGTQPRLATNPVAFGVPRSRLEGPHLVVDLATSAVAAARLAEHRDRGGPDVPEWVTPDGVQLPVGGAKGFGLALVVEALAGALAGAGTVRPDPLADAQGGFVVGVDASVLRPLADVTADLDVALDHVRTSAPADAAEPVRIPGEGTAARTAQRRADGVPVQDHTWRRLLTLAEDLGVRPPDTDPSSG